MLSSADQFVGQPLARRLLDGYLRKGRVGGTFLFTGERGLGKTTLATIFARAIVCEKNKEQPKLWFCGECYACRTIAAGEQPEYIELRPVGKYYHVEDFVSALSTEAGRLDRPMMYPVLLSHRIFLFSEAHLIGDVIGDKLLKVLEEPPETTIFLLDTDKPQQMLDTIRSRGNPIRLSSIAPPDMEVAMRATHPTASSADISEAMLLGGGRFVETSLLVRGKHWRASIKGLATALEQTRGIPEAAQRASEFGVESFWLREVAARNLEEDDANAMLRSSAAKKEGTPEYELERRRRELSREALIASYSYAVKFLVDGGYRNPNFLPQLAKLKQRINQNVDPLLSQVAFENAL
ncbi:MAG: hypothetical protein M3R04_06655 [bacterium]|nr:hypothetical protein [bacterium]